MIRKPETGRQKEEVAHISRQLYSSAHQNIGPISAFVHPQTYYKQIHLLSLIVSHQGILGEDILWVPPNPSIYSNCPA